MKPEVLTSWTLEIDYSRAPCLGADQKTGGLWERDCSTDGVQLELERTASGSGTINCQVFVIADAQFNILGNQMNDVQY